MNLTRALIQIALLVGLAGCVQGDEFWGRQLPGQPTQFILGYGSLINSSSRNATASQPIAAIPVRLSASFGYVRGWTIRSPSGFTALGLRRRAADETGQSINGVLYPVEGNDMAAFDAREEGYERVEVPLDQIQAMSWQRLPEHGKIWVYIPVVSWAGTWRRLAAAIRRVSHSSILSGPGDRRRSRIWRRLRP
jgi:cation transport regulator ChaC